MRNKPFSLSGILKVRKYKESLALQVLMQETSEDSRLSLESEHIDYRVQELYFSSVQDTSNSLKFEQIKYKYDYIASCKKRQLEIKTQRKLLEKKVEQANREYNKVRVELESIKILEKKYIQEQKRIRNKKFVSELQDSIVCGRV